MTAKGERRITGGFVNEAQTLGHRLRDHATFPAPRETVRVPLVIAGGGMGGLCAAWELERKGFRDFVLLEMEQQAGGNSRSGENDVSAYPWAAHYVPVPNHEAALVREMFEEFGLIRDGVMDELHLCHSPQERLFLHGRWQDGLEPQTGATARDHEQFKKFDAIIAEYRASGAFTIPIAEGAKASPLDTVSAANWLQSHQLDSAHLRWYVDYSCRDDYGAGLNETSAWAAVHYFASREHEEHGPFTWPEGNGWLVKRLLQKIGKHVRTDSAVYRIERSGRGWRVLTPQAEYLCDAVIFAAPTFLAHYIVDGMPPAARFEYSPWLTANLTLDRLPAERRSEMAWDNVIYNSESLGYVTATHQRLETFRDKTVWTYYWALARGTPAENRRSLLAGDWNHWKEAILTDLSKAHPDIRDCVRSIDIMRLGHAMIRPSVGFLFSKERRFWSEYDRDRLWFANSDLSGISIFEEAQYRGVHAARRALKTVGR